MRKRILWLGLSFLLVAALVLASCAPTVPGEEEEEEEEEEEKEEEEEEEEVGVPQYGGTLTIGLHPMFSTADPESPNIMDGGRLALDWHFPVQESPLIVDFVKYGPRGTGEFMCAQRDGNPLKYMTGQLLEDWEISNEKVVWHVRPGIYWAPTEDQIKRGLMEGPRELTAADVVADILWFREAPGGIGFKEITTADIKATGRYTLEIPFSEGYNYMLMYLIGYEDRSQISPPETEESRDWADMIGTGPFQFEEYVVGSHMSFVRNPNWWQTATIDGVGYELPFVDRMIVPIMPDLTTQVAALRTAKLEWTECLAAPYWKSVIETAPGIEYRLGPGVGITTIEFMYTAPPLDDVNVRRALHIGTNLDEFIKMMGVSELVDLPVFCAPYTADNPAYRPLEEWPEDVQILYDYNPELASEMLRKAGVPEGFELELLIQSLAPHIDLAEVLQAQWEKIGIDVKINAVDVLTHATILYDKAFKHAGMHVGGGICIADTQLMLYRYYRTPAVFNWGRYSNPDADVLIAKAMAAMDVDEQMRYGDEALQLMWPEVPRICIQPGTEGWFWWPWIKNYYGERNVQDYTNPWPVLAHAWVDQDLKAEMGY